MGEPSGQSGVRKVEIESRGVEHPRHLHQCKLTYSVLRDMAIPDDDNLPFCITWKIGRMRYLIPIEVWRQVLSDGAELEKRDNQKAEMPEPAITLDQCMLIL